jgi:hypothetical protein
MKFYCTFIWDVVNVYFNSLGSLYNNNNNNNNNNNSCKRDTNVIEHQERDQESNSTAIGKVENKSAEGEQHTVRNKLKEDLQIM